MQNEDPSSWFCHSSLPNFLDTVAPCLCYCSHLQLDMHNSFDFPYFISEIAMNLVYIWISKGFIIIYCLLACVASTSSFSSARASVYCHVVLMCLPPSESVNKVNLLQNSPRHLNSPPSRRPWQPQIIEPRFPASIDCPPPPTSHTPFTPLHATQVTTLCSVSTELTG